MARIRLCGVDKLYGDVPAVRNLELECPQGRMTALLGPSGCGKSSTLKMIAGIESVSRGDILFDDRNVTELAPNERNIAMVFEDYALYPHMSAFDNIAFPLRLRRQPAEAIACRVGHALELLGLEELREQDVSSLSGGAQQRIAIGRALVRDPELILFDEPLSHLDGNQRIRLRTEMKRLQMETGLTTVLVTHDQTEAMAMADAVAVMSGGVLQQLGEPETLYHHPANLFVADFIGEPPMNLLPATLLAEGDTLRLQAEHWSASAGPALAWHAAGAGGRSVVLGIRPEHVRLADAEAGAGNRGRVAYRESRGDVDVVVLDAGGVRVIAETPARRHDEGEPVSFEFPPHALHLFDAAGGHNLQPAADARG